MKNATKKLVLTSKGKVNKSIVNDSDRNGASGEYVKVSKVASKFTYSLLKM